MRINFFGGPSSGKSTTAAWLFSQLKDSQISVELVGEYCKSLAYKGYKINPFDQIYIFGKQMNYEYRFLSSGVKNIVTDSPTLLSTIYTDIYFTDLGIAHNMVLINDEYEKKYPSFNIFLERKSKPYIKEGRYQNLDEAKSIDAIILHKIFNSYNKENVLIVDWDDRNQILCEVLKRIDK